jgi:hypothetical protein
VDRTQQSSNNAAMLALLEQQTIKQRPAEPAVPNYSVPIPINHQVPILLSAFFVTAGEVK